MTGRQVAARIDFWRKELEPLGLMHWRFALDIEDDPQTGKGVSAAASVLTEDFYDTAQIVVAADSIPDGRTSTEALDRYIVHELLHIVMRDLDQAIESIKDHLAPPAASQWEDRMEHEEEGVVDRIARAIVAMHYKHQG